MSYILEAIQKADRERKGEGVQGPRIVVPGPPALQAPRRLIWPYLLAVALFVNAGLLGWWLAGQPDKKVSLSPEQQSETVDSRSPQNFSVVKEQAPPSTVQPVREEAPPAPVKIVRVPPKPVEKPPQIAVPQPPPPVVESKKTLDVSPATIADITGNKEILPLPQKTLSPPPMMETAPSLPSPSQAIQARPKPAAPQPAAPPVASVPESVPTLQPPSPPEVIIAPEPEAKKRGAVTVAEPPVEKSEEVASVATPSKPATLTKDMSPTELSMDESADDVVLEELEEEEEEVSQEAAVLEESVASQPKIAALRPESLRSSGGDEVVIEEDMVKELEQDLEKKKEEQELAKIPFLHQLPDTVQQSIPDIHISFHSYSRKARARLVSMNGKIVREGQEVTKGVTLEKITSKGVVLLYQSRRFKLDV